jgi:L-ascorbate metabolism protein UlaG (beta-lactamase superfamily)
MIKPLLKDDDFLRDIRRARPSETDVHLWWLGQSGLLLRHGNRFLLFDPYLSDSLTRKYSATDKPHVRMSERVIDPARLDFVDVVTSSHNHTDHLDAETLLPLMKANPAVKLVTGEANRASAAERLGVAPEWIVAADAGRTINVAGFLITGIPAAHNTLDRDEHGRCKYLGYVVRAGNRFIYHSGDTLWHDEILAHVHRFPRIDVALLPINGDRPERRVAGNLDGPQAARLAKEINARTVIPCHYDMFEFNTASPAAFEAECCRIGQPYRTLRAGERFSTVTL